jgi:hypothetical protein
MPTQSRGAWHPFGQLACDSDAAFVELKKLYLLIPILFARDQTDTSKLAATLAGHALYDFDPGRGQSH